MSENLCQSESVLFDMAVIWHAAGRVTPWDGRDFYNLSPATMCAIDIPNLMPGSTKVVSTVAGVSGRRLT